MPWHQGPEHVSIDRRETSFSCSSVALLADRGADVVGYFVFVLTAKAMRQSPIVRRVCERADAELLHRHA